MAFYGILDTTKWLIENGEPVSEIGFSSYGFSSKYLIQFTHNPFEFNYRTPLHIATRYNHYNIVKYLIDNNADLYSIDKYGNTPLHIAVSSLENMDIVKYVVSHTQDLNLVDNSGNTPLILAIMTNNTKSAKYLLGNGASINIINNYDVSFTKIIKESIKQLQNQNDLDEIISNILKDFILIETSLDEKWSPFQIMIAFHTIQETKQVLKNNRFKPHHYQVSINELYKNSPTWNQLIDSKEKKQFIKNVMGLWTPKKHILYPSGFKNKIQLLLLIELKLKNQEKYELPKELWYKIIYFIEIEDI